MIIEIPMTETEIWSVLRALATANESERTNKQEISVNTWVAQRLIKRLEAAQQDTDPEGRSASPFSSERFKIKGDPASHRSHR